MPIVVDREERRAEVVSVAFDLVAEKGIEALTFREIAAANGCSTSIVSHYFRNKNELLFKVYQVANARAGERLQEAHAAGRPLLECFDAILPVGEASRRNWRVWLAFWSRAHLEPAYLEERRRAAEGSLALYRAMLAERLGRPERDPQMQAAARRLIAAVAGIGLEACFAPDDWTVERMHEVLAAQLRDIGLAEGG
ncbi:TetR/AcrR family transcriptional regulator [Novosphingobium mathurense]|uniref:Transcriptional regulator, TetR family n=1 Tax=Novosphingobium mathurense TaxID=428990 RepID=A0A1U6IFM8_9SPHN|nr:TetR/AcrR family transcriptional regulator [Novosphingobium mathurense]SLK06807.1 transcriptional regulator, TetR family [Novosphingobium mathurense]